MASATVAFATTFVQGMKVGKECHAVTGTACMGFTVGVMFISMQ